MPISNTSICNMALDKLGAKRINDLDTDSSVEAIKCRTHFEQTRDALLRSHRWAFASARAELSQDTTDPDFEYDNQFILPSDYLAKISVWSGFGARRTSFSYAIEGERLLTNEDTVQIKYTKRVTDPAKFDALFVEILVLQLALKLIGLAGANPTLTKTIGEELAVKSRQARALSRQEIENTGRNDRWTWHDGRYYAATNNGVRQ